VHRRQFVLDKTPKGRKKARQEQVQQRRAGGGDHLWGNDPATVPGLHFDELYKRLRDKQNAPSEGGSTSGGAAGQGTLITAPRCVCAVCVCEVCLGT
jgi:hypothetical protein